MLLSKSMFLVLPWPFPRGRSASSLSPHCFFLSALAQWGADQNGKQDFAFWEEQSQSVCRSWKACCEPAMLFWSSWPVACSTNCPTLEVCKMRVSKAVTSASHFLPWKRYKPCPCFLLFIHCVLCYTAVQVALLAAQEEEENAFQPPS